MASIMIHCIGLGLAGGLALLADPRPAGPSRSGVTADLVRAPPYPAHASQKTSKRNVLHRAPDGLFYVQALVRGQPVRFVVDTGASVTVLSPSDAVRVGAVPDDRFAADDMETAGGSTSMQWAQPSEIRLAGHTVPQVQAALPGAAVRVSLLGQDVLTHLDSMTLRGNRLTLE